MDKLKELSELARTVDKAKKTALQLGETLAAHILAVAHLELSQRIEAVDPYDRKGEAG